MLIFCCVMSSSCPGSLPLQQLANYWTAASLSPNQTRQRFGGLTVTSRQLNEESQSQWKTPGWTIPPAELHGLSIMCTLAPAAAVNMFGKRLNLLTLNKLSPWKNIHPLHGWSCTEQVASELKVCVCSRGAFSLRVCVSAGRVFMDKHLHVFASSVCVVVWMTHCRPMRKSVSHRPTVTGW